MAEVINLRAKLTLDSTGFSLSVQKATREVKKLDSTFKKSLKAVNAYRLQLLGIGAAFVYSTLRLAKAIAKVEAIHRKVENAASSAEDLNRVWTLLGNTADRLGVSLGVLADSYGSLMIAAKSTNIETKHMEALFIAVSQKAAILGLSAQRTRLAFLAFEQMASKGVIAMEEVRRQLAEHIPGASGIMARSLGINVETLNKWIKTGKLMADDVLPLMAQQMLKENVPAMDKLTDAMQRNIGALETSIFRMKEAMAEPGFKKFVAGFVNLFTKGFTSITDYINAFTYFSYKLEEFDQRFKDKQPTGTIFFVALKEALDEFNEAFKMTEEEIKKKKEDIQEKMVGGTQDMVDDWVKEMTSGFQTVANEFTKFVVDLATGADVSLKDLLSNMSQKLLTFVTELLVMKPIMDWLAGWLTGISGQGAKLNVFETAFAAAFRMPKLASPAPKAMAAGGIINEPVVGVGMRTKGAYMIGEQGPEAVVPMDQMGGKASNVNVTINALDSRSVTELLSENPQAIMGPLVEAINNGDRGLSSSLRLAVT